MIIGVSDNGEIMGINIEKETVQNWINETKNKTSPSIIPYVETIVTDKLTVAVILVQEFPIKPIAFKGRYYKRMNNSNHLMDATEISDLYLQTLKQTTTRLAPVINLLPRLFTSLVILKNMVAGSSG